MTEAQLYELIKVLENIDYQLSRIADVLEEAAGWSQEEEQ